ncbi:MAG: hypothetical protein RL385_3317 [Pseudomonadota bacterium]|jgi:dienelactone hydrolase
MVRYDLHFISHGTRCAAWWYVPDTDGRHPFVVMAHGFGATREMGLDAFAQRFCAAGFCVLAFDYRHYGASEGSPRELLSVAKQREDYRAALAFAKTRPEADPERGALWGTSFSGGHVLALSAENLGVRAVVAQVPFTSGLHTALSFPTGIALRMSARGLADLAAAALGLPAAYLPVLGKLEDFALMPGAEVEAGYRSIVPPGAEAAGGWRNRAVARIALLGAFCEPREAIPRSRVPVLLTLGTRDTLTPAAHALRAALGNRLVDARSYEAGHFDFYRGPLFERAVKDQCDFLCKHVRDADKSPSALTVGEPAAA